MWSLCVLYKKHTLYFISKDDLVIIQQRKKKTSNKEKLWQHVCSSVPDLLERSPVNNFYWSWINVCALKTNKQKKTVSQGLQVFLNIDIDLFCLLRYMKATYMQPSLAIHTFKTTLIWTSRNFKFVSWMRQQTAKPTAIQSVWGKCFR